MKIEFLRLKAMFRMLCCLIFFLPITNWAQDAAALRAEIDKIIIHDLTVDIRQIPHLMVGIAIGEKTYFLDFGKNAKTHAIDSSTLFEIGDLSKVFTALLALQLEEQGKISLDSSWNHYLKPEYQHTRFQDLNLAHLLQHQSGLSKIPEGIGAMNTDAFGLFANYSKPKLLDYLRDSSKPTVSTFKYSNTGYALLELFVESTLNRSFEDLLQNNLLQSLALKNTYSAPSFAWESAILTGHNLGSQAIARPKYASFQGSLGMVSSANDLLQLATVSWQNPPDFYQRSLTDFKPIPKEKFLEIGFGWHRMVDKKFAPIYLHTGKTDGFRSYLAMVPATQTAVVVLSNSKLPQGGLGYYILKMINFGWNAAKVERSRKKMSNKIEK